MRPVLILATGPTLKNFEVGLFRDKIYTIAVSDAYKVCPWADMFYACDYDWWVYHGMNLADLKGDKVSLRHDDGTPKNPIAREVQAIRGEPRRGISSRHGDPIYRGHNSGFQALQLAIQMSNNIFLAGFDMGATGPTHFFGNHPAPLSNGSDYDLFVEDFAATVGEVDTLAKVTLLTSPSNLSHLYKTISVPEALRELSSS